MRRFFNGGSEVFRKLRTPDSLKLEAETKSLRPRPKGLEAKAEARGYEAEAETEAKILASRPVWPRGFNISGFYREGQKEVKVI